MDDLRIVGLVFPSEKRNRGRRRFAPHARGERMKIVRSIVAAAAASLVFMSASGLARSAEMTPALQTVIKAAQAEGSLKIVWLQSALGGGRGAKAIQDGMNKMFGTNIDIKFAPGGSFPQVGNQIAAEQKAGRAATSDVYLTSLNNAARLARLGIFQPVPWTKILPDRITPDMVEADSTALKYASTITTIVYNKNIIPDPPETMSGWLAPPFKGKLATTAYAAGFDAMGANDVWGHDKTIEYATALSGQISGLLGCGDENRIASGEFAAMIFACGGNAQLMKEKGAPIALTTAEDYISLAFVYFLVPKNAQSPSAAMLMTAYMLSPEGQRLVWEYDRYDLHLFPESKAAAEVAKARNSGGKVIIQSIDWALKHPEKEAALAEVAKILTEKK
jgi:ABC-type Fe3+ transport system substrate-binding protein